MGKKETSALLEETENSIAAIALAYDKLIFPDSLDKIELQEYLESLLKQALRMGIGSLRTEVEAPSMKIDITYAVTIGLIITECYNNTLKYAFDAQSTDPLFAVRLFQEGEHLVLTICDNGKGFGADGAKAGVGLELIGALCHNRLHTEPFFYDDNGACTKIHLSLSILS